MKNARKSKFLGAAAVSAIALSFAACAPQTSQWSTVEAPRENTITLVRMSHNVQFRANEDRLNPTETYRLATFIRDRAVGYGDRILLLDGGGPMAQRRADAVATVFARGGMKVVRDIEIEGVTPGPNEIRVLVSRHVVTTPSCPNWSKRADDDFGNTSSSHIGCTTTTNLGAMVANPSDLVQGEPLGPADGELSAFRVESYRHGKYPTLLRGDANPNTGRGDIGKEGPRKW
jgi:pilus assembly protein CpaD